MLAVGVTTYNSEATIDLALESICRQELSEKILFIIVDSESRDSTVSKARKILEEYGHDYIIEVRKCTIGLGRRIYMDLAKENKADYLLSLDSDVILLHKRLLRKMIEISAKYEANIAVDYINRKFKNIQELRTFAERVIRNLDDRTIPIRVEPSPWCGLGLTLIEKETLKNITVDPGLGTAEDRDFGYKCWLSNRKILKIIRKDRKELAYDLNIERKSDIYVKMRISHYLSNISRKVYIVDVFSPQLPASNPSPNLRKVVRSLIKNRGYLINFLTNISIFLAPLAVYYGQSILLVLTLVPPLLNILRLRVQKCENIRQAISCNYKFFIRAGAALLLSIPLYISKRDEIRDFLYRFYTFSREFKNQEDFL